MGLLPAYVEDNDELLEEELDEETVEPCEYEIDIKTGQLTGRIVYGIEAIKMWIYLTLNTPRYKSTIFPWSHGHEFEELMGKGYTEEVAGSEAERMTKECLLENEYITEIADFECEFTESTLKLKFRVVTTYGNYNEEVEINV